ncbi:MAG: DnaJ domain-containing protein [Pseudomonadota bacterium]
MFEKTEIRPLKSKLLVRFCLNTGETVEGDVFLSRGERLTDLLNDDRNFVPIDIGNDRVDMVAKAAIAAVHSLGDAQPVAGDPYALLRVNPEASDAEVRAAWMKRLKSCHPDRLMAMDLDQEILNAARSVSQRINAAYDQVMQSRKAA